DLDSLGRRILSGMLSAIRIRRHLNLVVRRRSAVECDLSTHCGSRFRHVKTAAARGSSAACSRWGWCIGFASATAAARNQRDDEKRGAKQKKSFMHVRILQV